MSHAHARLTPAGRLMMVQRIAAGRPIVAVVVQVSAGHDANRAGRNRTHERMDATRVRHAREYSPTDRAERATVRLTGVVPRVQGCVSELQNRGSGWTTARASAPVRCSPLRSIPA